MPVPLAAMLTSCTSADADSVRCQTLVDYVSRWFAGSAPQTKHLSEEPAPSFYTEGDLKAARKTAQKENDETNAFFRVVEDRIARANSEPLVECPDLRQLRDDVSYRPDSEEIDKTVDTEGLFYAFETLSVSMPGIDMQSGRAGFDASEVCGPLCGSGSFITYRRTRDGNWVLDKEEGTWIS